MHGGGILNNGSISISDSNFANNLAGEGGGIKNNGLISIANCIFTDNIGYLT
jgi:hypothetical protein